MIENKIEIKKITDSDKKNPMKELGKLSLDIIKEKDTLHIIAPIAGIKKDDLKIEIDQDILTIKGERSSPLLKENPKYISQECFFGDFARSIIMPNNANLQKISAKFTNNVLHLQIPLTKLLNKTIKIED